MPNFEDIDEARRLLGLGDAATLKEIKSAYRRLARHYHPDKHGSTLEGNEEMMKSLNRAYKVLVDYCNDYKYSFKEEDIARTYPYDEYVRRYGYGWFDGI